MSERKMRGRVVKALKPLDPVSVENTVGPGTPDVNCILGWIELKWIRDWPTRPSSIVRIRHFSPQQRVWLQRRWRRGGGAWLLLQVRREWLLFDGATASEIVGRVTRSALRLRATWMWTDGLRDQELRECLKRRIPTPSSSTSDAAAED